MTLDELLLLLDAKPVTTKVYKPVQREIETPRKNKNYVHKFYDASHLPILIQELVNSDDLDREEKYSVRYLVELNKRIIFAKEGRPGARTPGHRHMATECLAAGNIFFNEDHSKIISINHESGDFHPDINSLVWPLAALLSELEAQLNDNLSIIIITGESVEQIEVPKDRILVILKPLIEIVKQSNTPCEIRVNRFVDNQPTPSFRQPIHGRNLLNSRVLFNAPASEKHTEICSPAKRSLEDDIEEPTSRESAHTRHSIFHVNEYSSSPKKARLLSPLGEDLPENLVKSLPISK